MVPNIVRLLPSQRVPVWARYLMTVAIVLTSFGASRLLTEAVGDRFPFLLFFPAIIFCAGLFDRGSGILAVLISTVLAVFLINPIDQGLVVGVSELVALGLFLMIGLLMATIIEQLRGALEARSASMAALQRANERLSRGEQDKELLLEELEHRTKNNLQSIVSMLRARLERVERLGIA